MAVPPAVTAVSTLTAFDPAVHVNRRIAEAAVTGRPAPCTRESIGTKKYTGISKADPTL